MSNEQRDSSNVPTVADLTPKGRFSRRNFIELGALATVGLVTVKPSIDALSLGRQKEQLYRIGPSIFSFEKFNEQYVDFGPQRRETMIQLFTESTALLREINEELPFGRQIRVGVLDPAYQLTNKQGEFLYADVRYATPQERVLVATMRINGRVMWPGFFDMAGDPLKDDHWKALVHLGAHELLESRYSYHQGGSRGEQDERMKALGYPDPSEVALPLWNSGVLPTRSSESSSVTFSPRDNAGKLGGR